MRYCKSVNCECKSLSFASRKTWELQNDRVAGDFHMADDFFHSHRGKYSCIHLFVLLFVFVYTQLHAVIITHKYTFSPYFFPISCGSMQRAEGKTLLFWEWSKKKKRFNTRLTVGRTFNVVPAPELQAITVWSSQPSRWLIWQLLHDRPKGVCRCGHIAKQADVVFECLSMLVGLKCYRSTRVFWKICYVLPQWRLCCYIKDVV